ncbi:MAG: glycosyltransferase family 2 protein [Lachnospiraceae bacterium]|nr:glycosyltransferase family 2 protein [Candidatus Colinaster scatohippi]
MDLVTIIIPIYNIEREYLERCVRSVCGQTYSNLEIILVDDGSTDGTGAVCDELAKEDGRIVVFHKENGGSSSARNLGIDNANGKYLGFVDSDDYIDSDYVELMLNAIKKYNVPMAQISRDEIDISGNRRPDVCIPPKEVMVVTNLWQIEELLMHRGDCSFCTRLTDVSLFDGLRFPEGKLNEDFFLLMQMLEKIPEYVILPNQSYHVFYRIGSNSRRADSEDFSRVFIDIVDNADYAEKLIGGSYPNLAPVAKRFALYQRLDYMLHIPISQMKKDNIFYRNVVGYLRKNFGRMLFNSRLTVKNKIYLILLTVAPVCTRKIHKAIRL